MDPMTIILILRALVLLQEIQKNKLSNTCPEDAEDSIKTISAITGASNKEANEILVLLTDIDLSFVGDILGKVLGKKD